VETESTVNNRQHFRIGVGRHIVGNTNYMDTVVCVLDISAGGMGFQTNRDINIGTRLSITVNVLDKELTMDGTIVRKVLSEDRYDYQYGFRSLHDEMGKTVWVKLTNDLSILKKKQPWKVRYKECKCRF
jgi:hypothetical protein